MLTNLNLANVGCPHFKGEYRKYKNCDYTIHKAINEFIDNILGKANEVNINLDIDEENEKLEKITISDNYENGFENINNDGVENPFNMSHIRSGQDDDTETSQFGVGMKGAAIACCKKMIVYTNVDNKYYKVELDFREMCERKNPIDSYNPNIFCISMNEYQTYHH